MLPHRGVSGVESDDEPDSAEVLASVPDAPLVPPTTLGRVRTLAASSVDLSPNFPPVANQSLTPPCPAGSTTCSGNCAVFSAVYGIRTYMAKMANAGWPSLPGTGAWGENDNAVFSPTFTYNQQAVNGGVDDGTALTRVATSLRDVGAVTLAAVPWNPADPATSYVATYGTQAAANKITTYYDIPIGPNNITQIKAYLAAGFPIYMAVDVDGFGTMQAGGVWNGPYDGTKPGGHAMVIVGYDDNLAYTGGTGAFKVLNSWGTDWGNSGYFWLTYNWWSNGVASPESLVLQ
jgi:C1A family cysteine protease